MTAKKKTKAPAVETVTSYKGFDKDLKCRGFQYKVGENGIKAGIWYTLDAQGEFVEIED